MITGNIFIAGRTTIFALSLIAAGATSVTVAQNAQETRHYLC